MKIILEEWFAKLLKKETKISGTDFSRTTPHHGLQIDNDKLPNFDYQAFKNNEIKKFIESDIEEAVDEIIENLNPDIYKMSFKELKEDTERLLNHLFVAETGSPIEYKKMKCICDLDFFGDLGDYWTGYSLEVNPNVGLKFCNIYKPNMPGMTTINGYEAMILKKLQGVFKPETDKEYTEEEYESAVTTLNKFRDSEEFNSNNSCYTVKQEQTDKDIYACSLCKKSQLRYYPW